MPILEINDEEQVQQPSSFPFVDETVNKEPEQPIQPVDEIKPREFTSQEAMKTSTLFHKDQKLDHIIQYIRGMKWEVNYFLQLKDINEPLILPDINTPATTQKYNRINKLIITIQSAITQDNIENVTGEAIVNAGFVPNVHDVFLTELTGGRQALFAITEVQTRTYNLHQAYYITFKLHCFVDTEVDIYNDLVNKTMKEYVYDKEHLLDFSAPVILANDYKTKLDLKNVVPELLEYYMLNFVNYEKNVIALPTKTNIFVDTMLTKFLFKIVNYNDHHLMTKLTNLDLDLYKSIPCSIWDVIINRDIRMLKRANKNIGFKYTPYTLDNLITKKMNALGINFIANKLQDGEQPAIGDIIDISTTKDFDFKPPVGTLNRKYVVSDDFYNVTNNYAGLLEKVLMDYLNSRIINTDELYTLINQYTSWDTIDQFYLIPILMILVKDAYSKTFKQL